MGVLGKQQNPETFCPLPLCYIQVHTSYNNNPVLHHIMHTWQAATSQFFEVAAIFWTCCIAFNIWSILVVTWTPDVIVKLEKVHARSGGPRREGVRAVCWLVASKHSTYSCADQSIRTRVIWNNNNKPDFHSFTTSWHGACHSSLCWLPRFVIRVLKIRDHKQLKIWPDWSIIRLTAFQKGFLMILNVYH